MSLTPVKRALVSTYDKEGVVDLCRGLASLGVEILSTGGTYRLLRAQGVPVVSVSERTGFPEMLDGRVKTLHPKIHGGILAVRSNIQHMEDLAKNGIEPIDLVTINLYPFERAAATAGASPEEVIEMIDVGGPTMVRAAAKNADHVGVVVDPADYAAVLDEIREQGGLTAPTRRGLALKAFRTTAAYDAAVSSYLARGAAADAGTAPAFPETLRLAFTKSMDLVYGENPHQKAAFYRDPDSGPPSVGHARQIQGKPLSFNNILDFDGALALVASLKEPACAIVKHGNPCGAALAAAPMTAFKRALECDPLSAFGGVIAFNRPVDGDAAEAITEAFYEGVIAPSFDAAARVTFTKKKNLRLLATGDLDGYRRSGSDLRRVGGGLLVQDWDDADPSVREARVVTQRPPTEAEWKALEFAWTLVRFVKSNAIVYAFADRLAGVGAGQMSRVDSARFARLKAREPLKGAVMASDAFFPFRDGIDVAAEAGISAVVQPGGSIRDEEVIAAADQRGLAMVLVGRRHFRH